MLPQPVDGVEEDTLKVPKGPEATGKCRDLRAFLR